MGNLVEENFQLREQNQLLKQKIFKLQLEKSIFRKESLELQGKLGISGSKYRKCSFDRDINFNEQQLQNFHRQEHQAKTSSKFINHIIFLVCIFAVLLIFQSESGNENVKMAGFTSQKHFHYKKPSEDSLWILNKHKLI